jgi:hypothetical protein
VTTHDKFCDSHTHEAWCDCRKIDVIRADERAETVREEMAIRRRVLLNLKAQVDGLRCPILGAPHSYMGFGHDCHVKREEVLALIEEAQP